MTVSEKVRVVNNNHSAWKYAGEQIVFEDLIECPLGPMVPWGHMSPWDPWGRPFVCCW